jgi:hypothetical protein
VPTNFALVTFKHLTFNDAWPFKVACPTSIAGIGLNKTVVITRPFDGRTALIFLLLHSCFHICIPGINLPARIWFSSHIDEHFERRRQPPTNVNLQAPVQTAFKTRLRDTSCVETAAFRVSNALLSSRPRRVTHSDGRFRRCTGFDVTSNHIASMSLHLTISDVTVCRTLTEDLRTTSRTLGGSETKDLTESLALIQTKSTSMTGNFPRGIKGKRLIAGGNITNARENNEWAKRQTAG